MKKLLLALLLLGYASLFYIDEDTSVIQAKEITITDTISLDAEDADMTAFGLEDSAFQAISLKESIRVFEEGGNAVLFYAKPDSTECRAVAKVLNDAAEELGVTVYYIDTSSNVEQDDYNTLSGYISTTFVSDEAGNTSFFVPDAIAVKNGVITGYHVSTVSGVSVSSSEEITFTEEQYTELKNAYIVMMQSAADDTSAS